MNKFYLSIITIVLLLPASFLCAEEDESIPIGMEILKVGDANVLVPKGTQIRKAGDLNIVEDISEYSSRIFFKIGGQLEALESKHEALVQQIDKRFDALAENDESLEKEIEQLKKRLEVLGYAEDTVEVDMKMEKKEKKF